MTKSERAALREHWRQIVTECENRDASKSKRAWCEEHGIGLRLLYYWQRQFREGNDEPQSTPAFLDLRPCAHDPDRELLDLYWCRGKD